MLELGQTLLDMHREKLQELARRAAAAIGQLSDDDVNWRPNEASNSITNLVLHMAGNLEQRLSAGIGGLPDLRDRDLEFNDRTPMTRKQVLERLHTAFARADQILAGLTPLHLGQEQLIRANRVTVLDVLFTVVTHMAEHTGQILYIAKLRVGSDWRVLSIPHKRVAR